MFMKTEHLLDSTTRGKDYTIIKGDFCHRAVSVHLSVTFVYCIKHILKLLHHLVAPTHQFFSNKHYGSTLATSMQVR